MSPKSLALEMFERHLPLARRMALAATRKYRLARGEDLSAAADGGLWETALRYAELAEGEFKSLAVMRIWGAILDELRASDWLPRRAREKHGARFQEIAIDSLTPARRERLQSEVAFHWDPEEDLEASDRVHRLGKAMDRLPWRWAMILRCYLGGEKMREIGERLGISEMRVSQIVNKAASELARTLRRHRLKVPPLPAI